MNMMSTKEASVWGTRYPFHPFPSGWFVVAFSEDLAPNDIKPLRYFARDLVLFRTEDGKAVVADAHCPHQGTHLGYGGCVKGDTVVCPFHGWRFDSTGKCVEIPFTNMIPPKARIRIWPTVERSGLIFTWHDLDDREPSWQIPDYDESTKWEGTGAHKLHDATGSTHPQEIFENTVDFAHFPTVHSSGRVTAAGELQINGPILTSRMKSYNRGETLPIEEAEPAAYTEVDVMGPGVARAVVNSPMMPPGITNISWIGATPVDEKLTHFRVIFFDLVAPDCPLTKEEIDAISSATISHNLKESYGDNAIWANKAYVPSPMLSAVDGPVTKYREWFRQFDPRPMVVERA